MTEIVLKWLLLMLRDVATTPELLELFTCPEEFWDLV